MHEEKYITHTKGHCITQGGQQPPGKDLGVSRLRCCLQDALEALWAALRACEDKGIGEGILAAMAEVRSVQIDELRKKETPCDTGNY